MKMEIEELILKLQSLQKDYPRAEVRRHDSEFEDAAIYDVYIENGTVYIG